MHVLSRLYICTFSDTAMIVASSAFGSEGGATCLTLLVSNRVSSKVANSLASHGDP